MVKLYDGCSTLVLKLYMISVSFQSTRLSLTKSQWIFKISVSWDRFGTLTPMFVSSFNIFFLSNHIKSLKFDFVKSIWTLSGSFMVTLNAVVLNFRDICHRFLLFV